jgi:histidine triad (HIT) family protein
MAAAEYGSRRRNAFNLITSAGEWATQTVMHLHIHYIPRQLNDKLSLPWS